MGYRLFQNLKVLLFMPLTIALLFAVACGEAAQPEPTASSASTGASAPTTAKSEVPTATPEPTSLPVSQAGEKLDRLIIGVAPIGFDTNYSYQVTSSGLLDKRPVVEQLIGNDPVTNEYVPYLAESWQMAPNAKDWTLKLRKGVKWHGEWGEFTAQDVKHSLYLLVFPDSRSSNIGGWRAMTGVIKGDSEEVVKEKIDQMVEIVDDHTVIIHANDAQPELDLFMSETRNWMIESKARWDAIGAEGYGEAIIGTGPFKFVERIEGVRVAYEALDDHWRVTPGYRELEFRWVPEAATRLATLLTEEVHLSDVERASRPEAVNRGMKVLSSSFAAVQFRVYFGGQYYTEPEKLDPDLPWLKKEVRQAMNKAINRRAIVDTIMAGGKVVVPTIYAFHPVLDEAVWPGVFNQEWVDRFDEMYGYDPVKAKELLTEAGYPNGFEFDIYLYTLPGMPEIPDIVQAMALEWEAVGLQPNLINLEFSSVRKKYRSQTISGQMWPIRSYSPPLVHYTAYFLTASTAHGYQTSELDGIWEELNRTVDKSARSRLLRDMGNIIYDEFAVLQMFGFSAEIMANPKYVAEYVFPGTINGFFTHLEYMDTVPQ